MINIFEKGYNPEEHTRNVLLCESIIQSINKCRFGDNRSEWDKIELDTPLNTLDIDSLDVVEICMDLENKLQIKIPDEKWDEFTTVRNISKIIIKIMHDKE